jgi:hypothetical protein
MKAVLEIGKDELNIHLIEVINALFKQDVTEVVIRKNAIKPEEFDRSLKIEEVVYSLKEYGHNELLVNEIEEGLKNSSIYGKL